MIRRWRAEPRKRPDLRRATQPPTRLGSPALILERSRKTLKFPGRIVEEKKGDPLFREGLGMMRRPLFLLVVILATCLDGCMQTRHVETSNVTTCTGGDCPSATRESTYNERSWCGFWTGQPAKVQP
jgi:hypothetical protein